jgi:carbamoyltransferase
VHAETHPLYTAAAALSRPHGLAGVGQQSFNVRGKPIVCTPVDAWRCFTRTEMPYLAIGSSLIDKTKQPPPSD